MIQNISSKERTKYETVFFDLDGTIVKSGKGCVNGVRYMFDKIGYEENDETKMQAFVGPSVKMHLKETYSFSESQAAEAYVFFREYYDSNGIYESCLYDGIKDTIKAIKNTDKTLYLATLKPQDQAESMLERFDIAHMFSGVFGARHDLNIYHKNGVLQRASEILGDITHAVMVGDRHYDIISGQHVGFDTIGVLYGYGNYDELKSAGCDYLVDSVQDLNIMLGRKDT